jgi:geranylgeranyl diphosphate synthase, type II
VNTPALPLVAYLEAQRARVDEALARFLPAPPECPDGLDTAMRYSLFAGGKRFRPVLALAAAQSVAAAEWLRQPPDCARTDDEATRLALPAACALELIHTYSLIHDDLPAMHDDTLRRGRPTLHVVHGEGMAILAGDGLLTEAFALLAREPATESPTVLARRMKTIGMIATAAGAVGMVGGQAIDLQAAEAVERLGPVAVFSFDELRRMHACKTGAMIRASAEAGAIMSGGTEAAIDAVSRYAVHLGLAFQIVDDVLDVEGSTADLGKTAGKDAAAGKPTYPAIVGLDRSKTLAREAHDAALAALEAVRLEHGRLRQIADWAVERLN